MSADSQKKDQDNKEPLLFIRNENEDDDGYDPWSDRRFEEPLFEPDPWN